MSKLERALETACNPWTWLYVSLGATLYALKWVVEYEKGEWKL